MDGLKLRLLDTEKDQKGAAKVARKVVKSAQVDLKKFAQSRLKVDK